MKVCFVLFLAFFFGARELTEPVSAPGRDLAQEEESQAPKSCRTVLGWLGGVKQKFLGYVSEVKANPWRILVKKSDGTTIAQNYFTKSVPPSEMEWFSNPWVRVPQKSLYYLARGLQFFPRIISGAVTKEKQQYDFHPFDGTYNLLLNRPVRFMTKNIKSLGEELDPTLWVTLPATMILTTPFVMMYIDYMDSIQERREVLEMIKSEYLLRPIKIKLDKKEITEDEAVKAAKLVMNVFNKYYEQFSFEYPLLQTDEEKIQWSLQQPLLQNTAGVLWYLNGVPKKTEAFKAKFFTTSSYTEKLSDENLYKILQNTQRLFLFYNYISRMVYASKDKKDPVTLQIEEEIKADPFAKKLYKLFDDGKINRTELIFRLQEDYTWQTDLANWSIIGVFKRKELPNGEKSESTPVTIEDIRRDTFEEELKIYYESN